MPGPTKRPTNKSSLIKRLSEHQLNSTAMQFRTPIRAMLVIRRLTRPTKGPFQAVDDACCGVRAAVVAPRTRSTCSEERVRALELDRVDPEGHIFVPECDQGGVLFRRAQCHNSTGYCWCVDQLTGMPIPGISTHNATPDCSDLNTRRFKGPSVCSFSISAKKNTEQQVLADFGHNLVRPCPIFEIDSLLERKKQGRSYH